MKSDFNDLLKILLNGAGYKRVSVNGSARMNRMLFVKWVVASNTGVGAKVAGGSKPVIVNETQSYTQPPGTIAYDYVACSDAALI